jgi:hypothetical protein
VTGRLRVREIDNDQGPPLVRIIRRGGGSAVTWRRALMVLLLGPGDRSARHREEGVTFQRLKTWKASQDPRYAENKARIEHLYAIPGREPTAEDGDPQIVFCVAEFGPLNLQPRPGRQWITPSPSATSLSRPTHHERPHVAIHWKSAFGWRP